MTVKMPESIFDLIRKYSEAAYPDECCGFLLGSVDENFFGVANLWKAENAAGESRQNRYLIPPTDFLSADNAGRALGMEIIGIYHSHPDHPAAPSAADRESAISHYLYIIANVTNGHAGELSGWIFNAQKKFFRREDILIFSRFCL
jgi:proteasome lid subunit RPN8/RPN11